MEKYIALLRGVNVGGKNQVAMAEMKQHLLDFGFTNVQTYINSGNVLFTSEVQKIEILTALIETLITEHFGIKIPVLVIQVTEFADILAHAPSWWPTDDKEITNNAIFVLPPSTTHDILTTIGPNLVVNEQIAHYKNVLFWSAPRQLVKQTRWAKIANTAINQQVTVRNGNTTVKLLTLAQKSG